MIRIISKWKEKISMATKKVTYPELKMGSKGELVTQLQDLLSKAGSKIKVKGVFNIGTRSAVCAFQKKNDLPVTGVVDKKTWAKLLKVK